MKKFMLTIIIVLVLSLTGCIQKYEITDKQGDSAAEYMAEVLLDHDKNYTPDLTPLEDLKIEDEDSTKDDNGGKETSVTPAVTPTKGGESEVDVPDKVYTLSQVIGNPNFDIQYTGYKLYDTYPEDGTSTYFSLTPSQGNQLLVISFTLKNVSDKKKTLNLNKSDLNYQLDINVGSMLKPLLTLLENDLQYIKTTLDSGKSETVLLVFEVSKKIDTSNINLIASLGDKTEIIEIK